MADDEKGESISQIQRRWVFEMSFVVVDMGMMEIPSPLSPSGCWWMCIDDTLPKGGSESISKERESLCSNMPFRNSSPPPISPTHTTLSPPPPPHAINSNIFPPERVSRFLQHSTAFSLSLCRLIKVPFCCHCLASVSVTELGWTDVERGP